MPESDFLVNTWPLLELNSPADRWWRVMSRTYRDISWIQFIEIMNSHFIKDTREPDQMNYSTTIVCCTASVTLLHICCISDMSPLTFHSCILWTK